MSNNWCRRIATAIATGTTRKTRERNCRGITGSPMMMRGSWTPTRLTPNAINRLDDHQCHALPVIGAAGAQVGPDHQRDDGERGVSLRDQPDADSRSACSSRFAAVGSVAARYAPYTRQRDSVESGHHPPVAERGCAGGFGKTSAKCGIIAPQTSAHTQPATSCGHSGQGESVRPSTAPLKGQSGKPKGATAAIANITRAAGSCGRATTTATAIRTRHELDDQRRGAVAEHASPAVRRQGHLDRLRPPVPDMP